MPAEQVTFRASLEDNVSPNLEKLEKQLKAAGASPVQIKMMLDAVDNATPKIKEAQHQIDKLPKKHLITLGIQGGVDKFKEEIRRAKDELTKPVTMPFKLVDQNGTDLKQSMEKLFTVREKVALPLAGSMPGANLLYGVGAGAGIAGAVTSLAGILQQSFQQNVEIEQAHQKLTVALRDSAGATTELNKVIAVNQKSPFTFQQTMQADVLARSYQMPVFPGENKNVPQGYLKMAGNMAAAMGTSPDESMMALAMARQHMFRRMQMYGVRMTAQDFGPSGRFAGMSVDQALATATKRFNGAMSSQMKTFSGMMSNIHDVVSEQIVRPVGATLFQSIEGTAGKSMQALQQPGTQKKIGEAVEKFQHLTTEVIQGLSKMKDYFETHLKKPLEDVINAIKQVGAAFAQAFGGTASTVIKTFSEALMSITTPLAQIAKDVPAFGTLFGYMKALQMMGLGGTAKPLQTLTNAINPQSGQGFFGGLVKGLVQLPGMLVKLGGFAVFTDIMNAHKATMDMNNQFSNMKGGLDSVNQRAALLAAKMGESETHMKNLIAAAAQGIPMGRMTPGARANLALNTAQGGFQLSNITGIGAHDAVRAVESQMKESNQYSITALHKFGSELIEAAAVAKEFKISWTDAMRIMQTFATQAGPIGLGGLKGLPSVLGLSQGFNQYGVTQNQQNQGLYTPDAVLQQLMTQYKTPTITDLLKIPKGQLGQYWNFKSAPGAVNRYGKDEQTYEQQGRSAAALQQSARSQIGQLAPSALQGQYGVPQTPVLWQQAGLATNFGMFSSKTQSPVQVAEKVKQAWSDTVNNYNRAVQTIAAYQAKVDQTQNTLDQFTQAQASVNLQMQAFQHTIQLQQRVVEDASLKLQEYTFDNLRPLERELTRVQNAMEIVNHTMEDAQYNMGKFADGLLEGEQAALNQLHALSLYNEQLNYLKMQYTQIGAQLGTQVYERGYSSRVAPLMGLSLEMQMQQLQRKQQMAQAQYDITYGEGHYKMQQAQRTQFQRQEMPLGERLRGIKESQSILDKSTIQQHKIQDIQFALQERMFKVNEVIANQQDHLTRLQLSLTKLQQSSTMRHLEDEQYNLGQVIGATNIKLTQQNKILSQWQNTLDDLNQKKQDLQSLFDTLLTFNASGGGQFNEVRKMIREGATTGLIGKKEENTLLSQVDKAQKAYKAAQGSTVNWWQNKPSVIDVITEGIKGFFTGDLFRKLGDIGKKVPLVGPILSEAGSIMGTIMPVLSLVATTLAMGGAATWAFKRMLVALLPDTAIRAAASGFGALGGAMEKTRVPGVRGVGSFLGSLGSEEALSQKLSGSLVSNIFKKFEPLLHPIEHWRSALGRGAGAALGFALTGNPLVALLGGMGGSKIGKSVEAKDLRNAAHDIKTGASEIKDMPKKFGDKVKTFGGDVVSQDRRAKIILKGHEYNLEEAKKIVARNGTSIDHFKDSVGDKGFKGGVRDFVSEHKGVGRFAGAVSLFVSIAQIFQSSIGGLVNFIKHTLHIGGPGSDASKVASATGKDVGALERALKDHPELNAKLEAAQKAGVKVFEYAGKLFKFASVVGGALSLLPAGESLIQGKVGRAIGQGANAATYFMPGLGEAQVINQILSATGVVSKNSSLENPNNPTNIASRTPLADISSTLLNGPGDGVTKPRGARSVYQPNYSGHKAAIELSTSGGVSVDLLVKNRQEALNITKQFNHLSSKEQEKLNNLNGVQQQAAQQAALTGPHGLQKFLDNQVNQYVEFGHTIINLQTRNQKAASKAMGEWYTLSGSQQKTFLHAYQEDHRTALQALLSGPGQLKNFLNSYGKLMVDFHNANLGVATDAGSKMAQITNSGYINIGKTTDSWLKTISETVQKWERNNGLPMTVKDATKMAASGGQGYFNVEGFQVSAGALLSRFAHGGIVDADPHKVGPGKTVRMVEEGHAEMVIPLAPHRRDRARSLVKQAQGLIGEGHHHNKMQKLAAGGYVFPFGGPVNWERTDMGVDFSMAPGTPIGAIGDSKLTDVHPFYQGQPILTYQFLNGPDAGKYWYMSEQIAPVTEQIGAMFKAGQMIGRYASSGTGIETGWAGNASGATLAQTTTGYSEGQVTPAGLSFRQFLQGLAQGKITGGFPGGGVSGTPVPPIHLKHPPGALKNDGIIGPKQYAILERARKKWEKHLNSMTAQGGTGGALAGKGLNIGSVHVPGIPTNLANRAIAAAINKYNVPPWVFYGMFNEETSLGSGINTSSTGAIGPFQFEPGTASGMGYPLTNTPNLQQFEAQAMAAAHLLSQDYGQFHSWIDALAAYNAGGGNIGAGMGYANAASVTGHQIVSGAKMLSGGMRRVPYDNYPAMLHQDEMVVPAAVAHAARAHAGAGLTRDDKSWVKLYEQFIKEYKSISNIEYDIHHIKKYVQDTLHQKPTGPRDTQVLKQLNAELRGRESQLQHSQTHYTKAVQQHLKKVHDQSGGENTLAGVQREKAKQKQLLHQATVHDPKLHAAINKLHKDQNAYNKLNKQVSAKGHKESSKERNELKKLLGNIHKDQSHIKTLTQKATATAQRRYVIAAAERGVNAGILRAVTNKTFNKQQLAAYKRLEAATAHGASLNSKQVKELQAKLNATLLKGQKDSGQSHKDSGGYYKAHVTHMKKQADHMTKTEEHQAKLEDKMNRLITKDQVINLVANINGPKVSVTRTPTRARAR